MYGIKRAGVLKANVLPEQLMPNGMTPLIHACNMDNNNMWQKTA